MTHALTRPAGISPTLALVRRNLAERRRFLAGIAFGEALIAVLVTLLYESIGPAYADAFVDLPEGVRAMFGGADFGTVEGFLQAELFSFVGPGLAIAAGVSVAAGSLAGAEQTGRLALITTSPIRRFQVLAASAAATVLAAVVAAGGLFVGIAFGAVLGGLDIGLGNVAAACISAGLLGATTGMAALVAGAATGQRGVAIGVGSTVAVASYLVDAFFPLNSTLTHVADVSLWYPFAANEPLVNGLHWGHVAIFAALSTAAALLGSWLFERRDLGS